MKHLIKNILAGCFFLVITSCGDDFLDIQSEEAIPNEDFLLTLQDFQTAIIGGYSQMSLADWYGRYMLLIPDIMGDDIKPNASANRGAAWAFYTGGPTTDQDENQEFWQEIYQAVNVANSMINADFTPIASTQVAFDQVLGEAYALRALSYFDLVRLFSQPYTMNSGASPGVPLVTAFDKESRPARNTVAEIYAQIVSDFQQSINLMTGSSKTRFSRAAAQALLSRVYLYMGDYDNAETLATAVISTGGHTLIDSAKYANQFLVGGSSEAIFEMTMTLADNRGSDHIGGMYKETGYGDYLPAGDLLNLFSPGDVRNTTADLSDASKDNDIGLFAFDTNLDGGIYSSPDNLGRRLNKWPSSGLELATDNVSIIRLSEVYLNRAEARMRKAAPDEVGALADLNAIRQRAAPGVIFGALAGTALLDEIMLERRRELFGEGHRIFDITRTGSNLTRTDCTAGDACNIAFPNDRFIMAIPQVELDSNPNMVQNDSYGN